MKVIEIRDTFGVESLKLAPLNRAVRDILALDSQGK